MSFFQRIYGTIVEPRKTFRDISENPSILQAIVILVIIPIISVFLIFNRNFFIKNLGPRVDPFTINEFNSLIPVFIIFGIFGAMILTPIFHFISTAIYALLAEFFGYKSNGKGLFASLAFATIPSLISSILYFLFINLNLEIVSIITSLLVGIWVIVLKIYALKESYVMDGGKAALIYFIPYIAFITIIGMVILLSIISFIPLVNEFSNTFGVSM